MLLVSPVFVSVSPSPVKRGGDMRTALCPSPPSCGDTPSEGSPGGGSASPWTSPLTLSYWCRGEPLWTPPLLHQWSPWAVDKWGREEETYIFDIAVQCELFNPCLLLLSFLSLLFTSLCHSHSLTSLMSLFPTMVLNSLRSFISPLRISAMRFLWWLLTSWIRDSSASKAMRWACGGGGAARGREHGGRRQRRGVGASGYVRGERKDEQERKSRRVEMGENRGLITGEKIV